MRKDFLRRKDTSCAAEDPWLLARQDVFGLLTLLRKLVLSDELQSKHDGICNLVCYIEGFHIVFSSLQKSSYYVPYGRWLVFRYLNGMQ